MLRFVLGHVGDGAGPVRRLTMIGRFLAAGSGRVARSMLGHCQTTGDIANRLGLGSQVGGALPQAFERWDGKGVPGHRAGEQIDAAMRVVQPRRRGGECGPGRRRPPRPSPANAPVRSHPAGGRDPGPAGPGLSNKEMAERLSVSARTVSSHVEHVYAKIGVSTRGAAAMFAMRHGLVDFRADA
jgi:hypothetical protein